MVIPTIHRLTKLTLSNINTLGESNYYVIAKLF